MAEKIKALPAHLLEIWKNYTKKQRIIIISIVASVILALVILLLVVNHTSYRKLAVFEDTKSAGQVTELLKEQGILYETSDDGLVISVDSKKYTDAVYALGATDITTTGMSWEDALNNDMTTTESEKRTKSQLALQNDLRNTLIGMDNVSDAVVYLDIPQDDGTIFSENQETTVSAMLTLDEQISEDAAKGMAKMLAGAVGNPTTDNVTIIDSESSLLFAGGEDEALGGSLNSADEYRQKLRKQIGLNVQEVLLKYGYDDVEIGTSNIKFNMDKTTEMYTEYTPAEGQEQGLYSSTYNYKSVGGSSSGGIPGTDSNSDDTDYMLEGNGSSSSETTLDKAEYLPNERVTNTEYEIGAVLPEQSSLGVVLTDYVVYNEDEVEAQGLLQGQTWDEFVLANNTRTQQTVPDDVVALISNTTGVAQNSISVVAFQQPIFNASIKESFFTFQNILMIVLAVLIVALLIFVVFRGVAVKEEVEEEPELSVERLLATTKDNQSLEGIEFSDGSETRRMIEKFVDENPEAVAQLLRNWLNEDWD